MRAYDYVFAGRVHGLTYAKPRKRCGFLHQRDENMLQPMWKPNFLLHLSNTLLTSPAPASPFSIPRNSHPPKSPVRLPPFPPLTRKNFRACRSTPHLPFLSLIFLECLAPSIFLLHLSLTPPPPAPFSPSHLHPIHAGAIVDLHKRKGLLISLRANPPLHHYRFPQ